MEYVDVSDVVHTLHDNSGVSAKVKVMHITYDMRIGGTEMVIKNLIECNSDQKLEMSLFCIESPLGIWGEELKGSGTPVAIKERLPGFDLKLVRAIRRHIKKNRIDIVHCHQYTPWVYGVLAAAFTKTKVIFTEHGRFYPDFSSWKRKLINPLLMYFTNKVTCICNATKLALSQYENIKEQDIDVVYNGINKVTVNQSPMTIREQYKLPSHAFIFGTVARLDPIKNQLMMIEAFAKAMSEKQDAFLMIVGDGEMRTELENKVDELKIRRKVIFTGYIPFPGNIINAFDIFLLSSLSEGASMTLLEAMSLSKPCIVTDAGGNNELILNGYNGIVTENQNTVAYSEAIISMYSDKDLQKQYSEASLERFVNTFSVDKMSSQYHKYYFEMLKT